MKLTFTICNYRTGQVCKTVTAKSMNTVYAQYKRYCANKGAHAFVECGQDMSIGGGYWADSMGHEFILCRV